MEDEIPDELKDEYEELIEALEKLEENVELTDRLQQMYEGVRQLVQARQQLDAGVQAIREAYAEMGQELTEEEARELYSAEGLAHRSVMAARMASATAGSTRVVAALSR